MSIEQTLESINASLKTLVLIAQTGAAAAAELGAAAPAEKPAGKGKQKVTDKPAAQPELDAAGNPSGTVYHVIEKHNTVYAQRPGDTAPSIEGSVVVDLPTYQAKKEEFEKKVNAAAAQSSTAATAPSATAEVVTASNSEASVPFKDVVAKLQDLSKVEGPGKGRDGVLAILTKFGKAKVPELESLGKNAEILKAATDALTGGASQATDDALFG